MNLTLLPRTQQPFLHSCWLQFLSLFQTPPSPSHFSLGEFVVHKPSLESTQHPGSHLRTLLHFVGKGLSQLVVSVEVISWHIAPSFVRGQQFHASLLELAETVPICFIEKTLKNMFIIKLIILLDLLESFS